MLYIADGHHRAASAARSHHEMRSRGVAGTDLGDGAGSGAVLAVAFPHDQVKVLAYNRVVKDLAGQSPDAFLSAVGEHFSVSAGPAMPARHGEIAMYFRPLVDARPSREALERRSDCLARRERAAGSAASASPGHRRRAHGQAYTISSAAPAVTAELERLVNSGKAAVAFSLYPVNVADLMSVSDAGAIMPPKSTWFEPKLRDGLLVHII